MSRRLQLGFFVGGCAVLLVQLAHQGIDQLRNDAVAAGWAVVPIVLLYAAVHAADAAAWRTILAGEPNRPSFGRLYAMVVAGSALNFITPMVNLGGEPFKAAALARTMGARRAAGAVLIRNLTRGLGLLAFWLMALVGGWVLLPRNPGTTALLAAATAGTSIVLLLLLRAHRRGGLERLFDSALRVPGLGRLARRGAAIRPTLAAIDEQITTFARARPRQVALAVGCELAGRAIFVLEFCLIGWAIGVPVSYPAAFTIGGLEALVNNLLFFVPFEIGTRETATALLFQQLGYPADAGLFAALVSRVRDLAWIVAGLSIVGFAPVRAAGEGRVS